MAVDQDAARTGSPVDGAPLLRVRDLAVRLGGTEIVRHADLDLHRGQLVAVVGPNGAGKSTIVRAASGLLRPAAGTVEWDGTDVRRVGARRLARIRAFVPQRPQVPAGITAHEAVTIGRSAHVGALRRPGAADRAAVDRALERAAASELAERQLVTLSGGELQRVQLAVGLAQGAPALIADEPTSALDLGATATMARLLRALADDGLGILLVVHDLALACAIADTVVVVEDGRTVAAGPPAEVLSTERLATTWRVDAALRTDDAGRTALHVGWLGALDDTPGRPLG
jgi:iron complex transport system ATP-binding protein